MNSSFISLLKENWVIIVTMGSILLFFGYVQTAIPNHEDRIRALEVNKEQNALLIAEINSRLASIETSLKFIEKQLR